MVGYLKPSQRRAIALEMIEQVPDLDIDVLTEARRSIANVDPAF